MTIFLYIIIAVAAWFIGNWGWAQIVGSLQNIKARPNLIVTIIIWLVILFAGYLLLAKLLPKYVISLLIGYAVALVIILFQGKIR